MRVKRPKSITTPIFRRIGLSTTGVAARPPAWTLVLALALVLIRPEAFAQPEQPEQPVPPAQGASAMANTLDEAAPVDAAPPVPEDAAVTLERGWLVPDRETERLRLAGTPPAADDGTTADAAGLTLLLTGRFRHAGADTAQGLRITLPVPDGLRYVPGSATGPGAQVEYSVDGGLNFAPARAVAAAVPDELTHIRWSVAGEFPPGTTGLVSFEAVTIDAPAPPDEDTSS